MTDTDIKVGAIDIQRKADIRARIDAATAGPWYVVGPPWNNAEPFIVAGHEDPHYGAFICDISTVGYDVENVNAHHDAEFIAHARADVEALFNDVEFLENEARRAWDQVGRQADAKTKALRLLEFFRDDSPCRFDHHGGCQEHGWLEPEPGQVCPQQQLREFLPRTSVLPPSPTKDV